MIEFRDQAPGTDTCFKLECGHAFHTKCIVQFLTRTDHKCPSCNQHKTPEQKLEMEGVLRKILLEVRKDDRVKIAKNEHEEAKREYKAVMKQLDTESKEWIHKRAAELKIPEHKLYYQRSITSVLHSAEEVANEKGPKFIAAVKSDKRYENNRRYGASIAKTILFGKNYPGYRDWKLRHPRVWVTL
jgi:hypothetical protein